MRPAAIYTRELGVMGSNFTFNGTTPRTSVQAIDRHTDSLSQTSMSSRKSSRSDALISIELRSATRPGARASFTFEIPTGAVCSSTEICRDAGERVVVHQHSSVPVDMRDMRGRMDLKPWSEFVPPLMAAGRMTPLSAHRCACG
jgi:hypothetical protein